MYTKKKCVVIPCYNVIDHIEKVVNKIDFKIIDKVFIIDDCCPQNTGKYLQNKIRNKKIDITILKKNLGVGGATKVGFKKALKSGFDIIFKIDGDGQHNPLDISKFLKPLLEKKVNFCKGSRFINKQEKNKIPNLRYFGNIILTLLTRINCRNFAITDAVNGYFAIKSSLLKKIDLNKVSSNFFFEEDFLFQLSFQRIYIKEIPIKTIYHKMDNSNLSPLKTIIPFLFNHIKNFIFRIYVEAIK
jgi:dolichol-phosphate mannosyltransferase